MKKFTLVNEQLSSEYELHERIDTAIQDASEAFWDVIYAKFPEVSSDDESDDESDLNQEMNRVVRAWLQNNLG